MTEATILTTKNLMNRNVVVLDKKNKSRRIGKVRRFVFHPSEKRCIGVVIKRPDIALMFHRSDMFVALDSFQMVDGDLQVLDEGKGIGTAAIKRLGVDWDKCVLWLGMSLVTESGETLGRVGDIFFDAETGKVKGVRLDEGMTAAALLGITTIPANMIKGFRWGIGDALKQADNEIIENDQAEESWEDRGAILVSDDAMFLDAEGGLAESAARGTAMAGIKAKEAAVAAKEKAVEAAEKLKPKVAEAVTDAKPKMAEATVKAGEMASSGMAAAGEHLAKSRTMFADFAEEFKKGMAGEETETDKQEALPKKESKVEEAVKRAARNENVEKVQKAAESAASSVKKRTKGMFSGFMDEYRKAMKDD